MGLIGIISNILESVFNYFLMDGGLLWVYNYQTSLL